MPSASRTEKFMKGRGACPGAEGRVLRGELSFQLDCALLVVSVVCCADCVLETRTSQTAPGHSDMASFFSFLLFSFFFLFLHYRCCMGPLVGQLLRSGCSHLSTAELLWWKIATYWNRLSSRLEDSLRLRVCMEGLIRPELEVCLISDLISSFRRVDELSIGEMRDSRTGPGLADKYTFHSAPLCMCLCGICSCRVVRKLRMWTRLKSASSLRHMQAHQPPVQFSSVPKSQFPIPGLAWLGILCNAWPRWAGAISMPRRAVRRIWQWGSASRSEALHSPQIPRHTSSRPSPACREVDPSNSGVMENCLPCNNN